MFSAGRRPATEGFPENLIYNDNPNSPLAHLINMEFDGFSFEISNEIFSSLSDKLIIGAHGLNFVQIEDIQVQLVNLVNIHIQKII